MIYRSRKYKVKCFNKPNYRTIGNTLKKYNAKNIVIDPVMVSKSGFETFKI